MGLKYLFGSLLALAVPVGIFYGGMTFEAARAEARFEKARADDAEQQAVDAFAAGQKEAQRADTAVAATQALADKVAAINTRGFNIQAELKRALDASNLVLCPYPDDVRGVRSSAYQAARTATSATRN